MRFSLPVCIVDGREVFPDIYYNGNPWVCQNIQEVSLFQIARLLPEVHPPSGRRHSAYVRKKKEEGNIRKAMAVCDKIRNHAAQV